MNRFFSAHRGARLLFTFALLLVAFSPEPAQAAEPAVAPKVAVAGQAAARPPAAQDVIARVEDQAITFSELNTMLNSSAVVGLSIPALGTPQRDTVRITLLDKVVSANLIYLDALRQGADQDPGYQRAMQRFSNAMLADLYLRRFVAGDMPVSTAEIQALYEESIVPGTEMSEELRTVLEASVRKRRLEEQQARLRDELRQGVEITLYQQNFSPQGDTERADKVPVARIDEETLRWGEVKDRLIAAGRGAVKRDPLAMEIDARQRALQGEIDTRLLARRARAEGLEQDPAFQARFNEYRKTRLINLHRANLARDMAPTDTELQAYFEANRNKIVMPEYRKVQMVMLETEQEAASLKKKIEAGELTMFQAAAEHSVAPDAKQNLGELGWIAQGNLRPELDAVVFALGPAEIGGPVQTGEVWTLAIVVDVRDAQRADFTDEATRKFTRRRYIHEKLDAYVVDLRQNDFKVEVYEDRIVQLAQQEADMVKRLAEKAGDPASVTQKRIEEMQELMR